MKRVIVIFLMLMSFSAFSQKTQVAVLRYRGGGDWYSNPTSLPNLVKYCNQSLKTDINIDVAVVDVGSPDIFNYPFIHMTGHGNVVFDEEEVRNLRNYLLAGGFLHIDDNYGMKDFVMAQIQKVFPELQWVELPYTHEIFQTPYSFPDGLPKIHEHDNKSPQALAMIYQGRMVCLFTYECDLGDGWEDQRVHHDSEETRLKALKMGANIVQYVFSN
ncbi:MAG: DUF4159 domain-containing protein [Lentimicrobiaceae bacterium]|nr:DUF4159 domain-containing protein [Lentimicrobiaceae bacterium]